MLVNLADGEKVCAESGGRSATAPTSPREGKLCCGLCTGTDTVVLGQAELLAPEMTNSHIHFPDLTAIFDTGTIGFILQAWRR